MSGRRQQILEAFRKRLHHYGYDKTTMAEIATDVGISVGTLYLEFESKEDILAGLMEETAQEFERAFRAITESEISAPQKLKEVLLARVALSDRCCRAGAHSGEVLIPYPERCRRMQSEKEGRYLALLESVLAEGVASGELEAPDPSATARVLRDALGAYLPPLSIPLESEELMTRAEALLELLVRGLQPGLTRVGSET